MRAGATVTLSETSVVSTRKRAIFSTFVNAKICVTN